MLRSFSRRQRCWLAIVQVFLLLCTFAVPVAAANPTPLTGTQLIDLLRTYGVVKGDEQGNLNLDKPIKRAEMITIMVRAMGAEAEAELYKGFGAFQDAKGHWAEGYITYATMKGLVKGDGNGFVRPEDPITYAEALTLLARLVQKEPTTGEWPLNVILTAAELGIMPPGVTAGTAGTPAVRGLVFQSMGTALITVKDEAGTTFLAKYVDKQAPVLSVDAVSSTTTESTASVRGSVTGATSVMVNGVTVSLTGTAFASTVPLSFGDNQITVLASDVAGNTATQVIRVNRQPKVTRIEVTGGTTVGVGSTTEVKAKLFDATGKEITDAQPTVTAAGVGSYSSASGIFAAGSTPGNATITFKSGEVTKTHTIKVLGPSVKAKGLQFVNFSPTAGQNNVFDVEIRVIDGQVAAVIDDYGREVTLTSTGISGLTVTPTVAKTEAGIAKFRVSGAAAGLGTLTAAAAGLSSTSSPVTITTPIRVVLTPTPATLTAVGAGTTQIRAMLLDTNNQPVTNTSGSDILVQVTRSGIGDGALSGNLLTIKAGQSNSAGYDILYTAGFTPGTLMINGQVLSGHSYSVISANISIVSPTVGGGTSGGSSASGPAVKLQIIGVGGYVAPGATADVILRVVDNNGNSVLTGNYAFTVKARTSNNDIEVNGLPQGVTVTLGSTAYVPVAGATSGVTGVTVNGLARLRLTYNKSGFVHLEPVAAQASSVGRDDTGNVIASTASTYGFTVAGSDIPYSTGAATQIGLTASFTNSANLTYSGATNAPAPVNSTMTLTASLRDATGGIVPNASAASVELYRNAEATPIASKSISNGTVDFTIATPQTAGTIQYKVTTNLGAGVIQSTPITVHVSSTLLAAPAVISVRGATDSGPGLAETVRVSDQYLQFLINSTGTPGQYGVIKVYRYSGGAPIHISSVRDLGSGILIVNVPKNLIVNQDRYRLTFDNGAGDSPLSAISNVVTVQSNVAVTLTSASYDADTNKLTLTTNYAGTQATIDATKLTLTAPGGSTFRPALGSATGYGTFVIDLSADPALSSLETPAVFNGDVRLTAADGWLTQTTGQIASAVTTGISVGTFANVTRAYVDTAGQKLIIDTVGTSSGYFDLTKFSLGTVTLNTSNSIAAVSGRPNRYAITLTAQQATDLATYTGNLTLATGWFYAGGYPYQKVAGLTTPTYAPIEVTSASLGSGILTLYGSGFLSAPVANLDPTKITFTNEATSATYTLTDTTNATVTIVNDNTIRITLGTNDATTGLTPASFNGNLVFLTTAAGWFRDTATRQAPAVGPRQVGVGFSN